MGVIAYSVSQVIGLAEDNIMPSPAFGTRVRIDYLRGMGKSGDKFVSVSDIYKVLGTPMSSGPMRSWHRYIAGKHRVLIPKERQ